uniref:BON domain-containing protein n=1 Tax=uncultured Planctomycetota bacterium TaxID=120965 RepID=H5S885_9BACT|nr:hypothetical protein HGMM_F01A04C18 [uncultured Planctomycetota bacterium]
MALIIGIWLLIAVQPLAAQNGPPLSAISQTYASLSPGKENPVPDPQKWSLSESDWDLMMRIRAALLADPDLARHNLLVVARGGMVEVDGPVPNAALRDRIRQIVSGIPGVRQLRERLRIQPDAWSSRIVPRRLPPVDEPWRPNMAADLPAFVYQVARTDVPVHSTVFPAPPFRNLLLMPPVPEDTIGARGPLTLHAQNDPTFGELASDPSRLFAALEQELRLHWRFRHVHVQTLGHAIYLTGTVESPDDLRELYHLLSRFNSAVPIQASSVRIAVRTAPHTSSSTAR